MSEIALPGFRGALLGAFAFSFALGQLFSAIGQEILVTTNPLAFRHAFYSEFVILGVWLAVLIPLPESPYWLAGKGHHDKAKRSLRRLVGRVDGYDIEREYAVILQEVEASRILASRNKEHAGWAAMLQPVNVKRTIIAALPIMYQNFAGTALIFGYTTYFCESPRLASRALHAQICLNSPDRWPGGPFRGSCDHPTDPPDWHYRLLFHGRARWTTNVGARWRRRHERHVCCRRRYWILAAHHCKWSWSHYFMLDLGLRICSVLGTCGMDHDR